MSQKLKDDGREVTLDLHGYTVDQAMSLAERLVNLAHQRGRSTVKLIHGSATSSPVHRNRTIKHALHDLFSSPAMRAHVMDLYRGDDFVILNMGVSAPVDDTPITILDITA